MKKTIDTPFLLVLCSLVFAGLLIFTSASLSLLGDSQGSVFTSVAISQLVLGLAGGTVGLIFFAKINYRLWRRYTPYFFLFAVLLSLLPFVPHIGLSLKGAARWIVIGSSIFQA